MAMFSKGRGMFGAPMRSGFSLPGIGDDITAEVARSASPDAAPQQMAATSPTYAKPSTANLIIGTIGDTLSQIGGGKGNYLPGLQMRQQAAQEEATYQRRRGDEYSDWERRKQYEAAHPATQQGTSLMQNYEWLRQANPQAAEAYLRSQTEAPPIVQTNPDGTKTVFPAGSVPRAGAVPQILQQLPPGVRPLGAGGATPQGARSFPVR